MPCQCGDIGLGTLPPPIAQLSGSRDSEHRVGGNSVLGTVIALGASGGRGNWENLQSLGWIQPIQRE